MSIYGFSGKPRSGKSYSAVEHCIIPALRQGRTVYHNMRLKDAALKVVTDGNGKLVAFDREISPAELVAGAPPGSLVVIDESVRYWPSGTRANKVPKPELEFFTMHGHSVGMDGRAMDIVLVCQDFGTQCANFIRELIEINYYTVKLTAVGFTRRYRLEIYEGVIKGDQPSDKRRIRQSLHKYRPEIYNCYVSHTNSQTGVAGEELHHGNATAWRNRKVYAAGGALLLSPLIVMFAVKTLHGLYEYGTGKKPGAAPAEHSEAVSAPGSSSIQGSTASPLTHTQIMSRTSKVWRLAGEVIVGSRVRYVIDSENGSRLVEPKNCKLDVAGNRTCVIDGESIAAWTGSHVSALERGALDVITPKN
jgi:zona occludens toxin